MRALRFLAAIIVALIMAVLLYAIHLLILPFDPERKISNRVIGRIWTGCWKTILGVKVRVSGAENIKSGGPFLFVSNHASYLDVLAMYHDFPVLLRFLAKKTLVWAPVFGIAFYTLGHVYIDRRGKQGQLKSLEELAKRARKGQHIFIFPGGKRAPDGRLGEWKKGAFVLATQMHIPIVPVAITGSSALHGIGDLFVRPGTIHVHIGQPINTENSTYDDRNRLLQTVRAQVEEMLND